MATIKERIHKFCNENRTAIVSVDRIKPLPEFSSDPLFDDDFLQLVRTATLQRLDNWLNSQDLRYRRNEDLAAFQAGCNHNSATEYLFLPYFKDCSSATYNKILQEEALTESHLRLITRKFMDKVTAFVVLVELEYDNKITQLALEEEFIKIVLVWGKEYNKTSVASMCRLKESRCRTDSLLKELDEGKKLFKQSAIEYLTSGFPDESTSLNEIVDKISSVEVATRKKQDETERVTHFKRRTEDDDAENISAKKLKP